MLPLRTFEAVPFAHQLYELRDAVRLTKDSLPVVGAGHNATHSDFGRIAKGIAVVAARMRWIAEQVPEGQKRTISTVHDDLDKLVEGASMIAELLAEVETQLDSLIEVAQALAEAEVLAAVEPASIHQAAAGPVSAAPPVPTPEPVQEADTRSRLGNHATTGAGACARSCSSRDHSNPPCRRRRRSSMKR